MNLSSQDQDLCWKQIGVNVNSAIEYLKSHFRVEIEVTLWERLFKTKGAGK
jgi:hypothetical protein